MIPVNAHWRSKLQFLLKRVHVFRVQTSKVEPIAQQGRRARRAQVIPGARAQLHVQGSVASRKGKYVLDGYSKAIARSSGAGGAGRWKDIVVDDLQVQRKVVAEKGRYKELEMHIGGPPTFQLKRKLLVHLLAVQLVNKW